jgi:hypothetical protein
MTNTSKDKDNVKEKDEIISARNRIKNCEKMDGKEKQISCMYETLHDITEAQDITNLTIRKIVDNSDDPRWLPIHITDNANAIILGISDAKGNPKLMIRSGGYVEEKVNSLNNKWNALIWKYEE